ncbi:dioxygenase [Actinomadura alba]|uniref:6-chlorohydroxyquinol-1,2-dioxygenase n=1 Tax=Actinomadura alba TaxID=406431 RepID=A0ABR7LMG9_9ACTN|nr:dioxygenase [Actinomadura alba]MBC6465794.1 6-chlorohydroxyquinol-1,2-dioxygenase [Actinomadura alba]
MKNTERLTADVLSSFGSTPDDRLRTLLRGLVEHLHAYFVENAVTGQEWQAAIDFLTQVGQACTEVRQEVILLSDVLGVSMLTEILNEDLQDSHATEATVLGPFHLTDSPRRELGDSIDEVMAGDPLIIEGRLTSTDGIPLSDGTIDVWQSDENGFYDVQVPDLQPQGNGRGFFQVDPDGRFWFRTVAPAPYPIPTDGPVGRLLAATKRHPFRPAHIHFILSAPGHRQLTTHVFMGDSPYLDSDAVFAVRDSLVVHKSVCDDEDLAAKCGVAVPFEVCRVDVVLERLETNQS